MSKIVDLGNGYGRLDGYRSAYASLTFPLSLSTVRKLHAQELIDDDEARCIFLQMGYSPPETKWLVAVDNVSTRQWKEAVSHAGLI